MSRVYDCFSYNGQNEMLRLKFEIMGAYVDYFVIIEAAFHFNGSEKGLHFNKLDFL